MEKYETIDTLGEGTFATVTRAKDLKSDEIVAIKKLKKKYTSWQECLDLREVKSLNKLKQSDNIIKLKEMIRVEDNLYLIFEYMEKNLYELITQRQNRKFNEGQIRSIMFQTLQGIAFMHKYGFFHRDLKPENLLVNGEKVKIADFGLAREIRSLPPYTDYVSTRWYRAPECILKSTNYNSPIDIWALGCIMAEMYNFKPLFFGNTEKEVFFRMCAVLGTPSNSNWSEGVQLGKKIDLKFPISTGNPLSQVVPDASKDAIDLLSEMLRWDPNKRSTASCLLNHPFFTKYPVPNRISTPEYNKKEGAFTSVSNKKHITAKSELKVSEKDDDISKMLENTLGFNQFIKKLKSEKNEEEKNYDKDTINKKDDFDDQFDKYYQIEKKPSFPIDSDNQIKKNLYNFDNRKFLNNKNENDVKDVLKKDLKIERRIHNEKDILNEIINDKKPILNEVDLFTDLKRNDRKPTYNNEIDVDRKTIIEKDIDNLKKDEEMDFDNCNVYLKNINKPEIRKRSALRFLEESMKESNTVNTINQSLTPVLNKDKKIENELIEFGSRRKKPFNLNEALDKDSIFKKNTINQEELPITSNINIESRRNKKYII